MPTPGEDALSELRGSRQPWHAEANCLTISLEVAMEIFYPSMGDNGDAAKQICGGCSVKSDCLKWAVDNGERFGIWGGVSERKRRKLR